MNPIANDALALIRKAADGKEVQLSSTWDELGFDSLDVTELLMQAEEQFGIHIEDSDAEKLRTVGDMVAYVERQRASRVSAVP
jgi:acyl carrier protein